MGTLDDAYRVNTFGSYRHSIEIPETIDVEWVKQAVEVVNKIAEHDQEMSHILEDRLHVGIMNAIINDEYSGDYKELMVEALKTIENQSWVRWYA